MLNRWKVQTSYCGCACIIASVCPFGACIGRSGSKPHRNTKVKGACLWRKVLCTTPAVTVNRWVLGVTPWSKGRWIGMLSPNSCVGDGKTLYPLKFPIDEDMFLNRDINVKGAFQSRPITSPRSSVAIQLELRHLLTLQAPIFTDFRGTLLHVLTVD